MIQITQLNMRPGHSLEDLKRKAAKTAGCSREQMSEFKIVKRSLDARKKPDIFFSYSVRFSVKGEALLLKKRKDKRVTAWEEKPYRFPEPGQKTLTERPVIIGMGPAGLFCGYYLAKHGYAPILLERGRDVDQRSLDVENFWKTGALLKDSNVQFGEGGAGTFSDGKLNTLIKDKDGRNKEALKTFVDCGAPENILYDAKPHIGTDILRNVVKTMRSRIIKWGGQVYFENKVTDILTENEKLTGLLIETPQGTRALPSSVAVLAVGHSARDTFQILYDKKVPMEAKAFAVGFRVQHPQKMINADQYGLEETKLLPAASYKLTARTDSLRSVYSFCMCPGGYVVNASSEEGRVAVNGMSYSDRAGENANSAVIVSVTPEDFGSCHPLAGVRFQRELEERAFRAGRGKIPSQYYGDYKAAVLGRQKETFTPGIRPQICGGTFFTDISRILPEALNRSFVEGMEQFGKILPGFDRPDTILSGVESRTSSPVRILRGESLESSFSGLYPCGEGAGYAGGIMSAAMDGLRVAEQIASVYKVLDESGIFQYTETERNDEKED